MLDVLVVLEVVDVLVVLDVVVVLEVVDVGPVAGIEVVVVEVLDVVVEGGIVVVVVVDVVGPGAAVQLFRTACPPLTFAVMGFVGQDAYTFNWIVPVTPSGTVEVAVVDPPAGTNPAQPTTGTGEPAMFASACEIVMGRNVSLVIVHVMTCEPVEQLTVSVTIALQVKAGAASPRITATTTPTTKPARPHVLRATARTRPIVPPAP